MPEEKPKYVVQVIAFETFPPFIRAGFQVLIFPLLNYRTPFATLICLN